MTPDFVNTLPVTPPAEVGEALRTRPLSHAPVSRVHPQKEPRLRRGGWEMPPVSLHFAAC